MARVIKLAAALAALTCLGAFGWQQSKIARLSAMIGEWNVKMEIKEPQELSGTYHGKAKFSWDPNKEHIRAEGSLTSGHRTSYSTGFLTFDDDGPESEHRYRGAFVSSDDGRILQLKGNFKGNSIVFEGSPLASDRNRDLKLKVTVEPGKDRFLVHVDMVLQAETARMLELTFTRKTT